MKIILQFELEERDYVVILQAAGMKGITTDELIRQAIREYINKIHYPEQEQVKDSNSTEK